MISNFFKSKFLRNRSTKIIYNGFKTFSNAAPGGEGKKTNIENVVQTDKAAKDQEHEELAYKFEREWKKIYDERNKAQLEALDENLTPNQKNRVEILAQALLELNVFELRYFSSVIRDKVWKTTGINPLKLNTDWPALKQLENGSWPPANPNWFMQQEAIAKLWPMGQQGFAQLFGGMAVGGAGGAAPGAGTGTPAADAKPAAEAKKEEAKEEKKVEKANYDIELAGVDAAQKIKIIKEVRQLLNLGLKEAKDIVEKTPVTIKKGAKKDEAEKIKEVLTAVGCTINLL